MVFIFQFVNVMYYIDLQILKNPCIPGINMKDDRQSGFVLEVVRIWEGKCMTVFSL